MDFRTSIDPGIVDEDIDLPILLQSCIHHSVHVSLIGNIRLDSERFTALLTDCLNGLIQLRGSPTTHDHARPLFCQSKRQPPTDTTPTPGDDCNFAIQPFHISSVTRSPDYAVYLDRGEHSDVDTPNIFVNNFFCAP
jgi:hypothetical protein